MSIKKRTRGDLRNSLNRLFEENGMTVQAISVGIDILTITMDDLDLGDFINFADFVINIKEYCDINGWEFTTFNIEV